MSVALHRLVLVRAAAAAGLMALAGTALAQQPAPQEGPVVLGEHAGEWKPWYLAYMETELSLYGRYQQERERSAGQPETKNTDTLLRATMDVGFEAYIGHKNFIDLTGNFQLGYEEEKVSSNTLGGDTSSGNVVDLYNIRALILGESKAPVTVYSQREETLEHRDFAGTLTITTAETGASVELRSEVAPLRIAYFHRDQNQDDPQGALDRHQVQDTVSLGGSLALTAQQRLEYTYEFDRADESQGSTFHNSFDRHDGSVVHTLNFGDSNEHSLRSSLRVFDETGFYQQSTVRLDEQLNLQHSDRLSSRYNFTLMDEDYGGTQQRQAIGSAMVRHRLFDSLTTTGTVGGYRLEIPDEFTSDSGFVSLAFDYLKKVPYGRLEANATGGYVRQVNGERGTSLSVHDVPKTFTDPQPIVIDQRNIVPGSVSITDLSHFPFSAPTDYTVAYFPDRIEITRDPFGSILNGQTVLVTYTIGPEPSNTIDTMSVTLSARYTVTEGVLTGLSPYISYQQTTHYVDAVDPSLFVLDDVTTWRYGLEYRIAEWTALGERQDTQSTLSPYDRMRLQLRYDRRFDRWSSLAVELTRDEVNYHLTANHVDLNTLLARYTQQVAEGMDVQFYVQYRDQRDDVAGHVTGLEETLEFTWRIRQTSIFASVHNADLSGRDNDNSSQLFTLGVNRTF